MTAKTKEDMKSFAMRLTSYMWQFIFNSTNHIEVTSLNKDNSIRKKDFKPRPFYFGEVSNHIEIF